jgi:hypothetical protein
MDQRAEHTLANWPAAKAVYGWLSLDRRGNWLIKGERVSNSRITDYIARNYTCDGEGRWYVQYGLQQVFVALEYTPFVLRVADSSDAVHRLVTHDRRRVITVRSAWLDEAGSLLLETEHGVGVADDRDLERLLPGFKGPHESPLSDAALATAIERLQRGGDAGLVFSYRERVAPIKLIASGTAAERFGFVRRPLATAGR